MAISLISGGGLTGSKTDGTDVTLTFPAGVRTNDLCVVFGGHYYRSGASLGPQTGYGYTEVASHNAAQPAFGVWIKWAGTDTDVVCYGSGTSGDGVAYGMLILRGVNPGTPQDQTAVTVGPTTSTNPNCGSIVTQTDGAMVLAAAGSNVSDTSRGTVTNYTLLGVNANGTSSQDLSTECGRRTITSAGTEDPPAWSSWASGAWYAITVALRAAIEGALTDNVAVSDPAMGKSIWDATLSKACTDTVAVSETVDRALDQYNVALTDNLAISDPNLTKSGPGPVSVGSFLSGNSTVSETQKTFTTSADLAAGDVGVIVVAFDNVWTTDPASNFYDTTLQWVTVGGYPCAWAGTQTNGQGVAGDGASVWVGTIRAPALIPSGSNVVVDFGSNSITSKAISGWAFSVPDNHTLICEDPNVNWWAQDAADPGSLTSLGTAVSKQYVWLRAMAHETNSSSSLTPTSGWTAITGAQANTGTAATSMAVRGEFKISTGTSSGASNPTYAVADMISLFTPLAEGMAVFPSDSVAISDPAMGAEVVDATEDLTKDLTDGVNVSEEVTPLIAELVQDLTDTVHASDSVLNEIEVEIETLSDSVVVSDAADPLITQFNAALTDNISVTESVTPLITQFNAEMTDSVAVSEEVTPLIANYAAALTDNVAVSESVTGLLDKVTVDLADTVAVSESVTPQVSDAVEDLSKSLTDNVAASETVGKVLTPLVAALTDNVSVAEVGATYHYGAPAYGIEPNVAAQFLFDEASGDIVDEVSGLTLTASGSSTYNQTLSGVYSGVSPGIYITNGTTPTRYFSKSGAVSELDIGTSDFTMEYWMVNVNQGNNGNRVFDTTNATNYGWSIEHACTVPALILRLFATDGTSVTVSKDPGTIRDSKPHKIRFVGTRSSVVELFVDGVSKGTTSIATLSGKNINTSNAFVGARPDLGSNTGLNQYTYEFRLSLNNTNDSGGPGTFVPAVLLYSNLELADSVAAVDTAAEELDVYLADLTDAVAVSESVTGQIAEEGVLYASATDGVAVSETVDKLVTPLVSGLSESVAVSESVTASVPSMGAALTDSVELKDEPRWLNFTGITCPTSAGFRKGSAASALDWGTSNSSVYEYVTKKTGVEATGTKYIFSDYNFAGPTYAGLIHYTNTASFAFSQYLIMDDGFTAHTGWNIGQAALWDADNHKIRIVNNRGTNQAELYVDGVTYGQQALTGITGKALTSKYPAIGQNSGSSGNSWEGTISEARISIGTTSNNSGGPGETAPPFNYGSSSESNVVAHWKMQEPSGNITSSDTNAITLTAYGSPVYSVRTGETQFAITPLLTSLTDNVTASDVVDKVVTHLVQALTDGLSVSEAVTPEIITLAGDLSQSIVDSLLVSDSVAGAFDKFSGSLTDSVVVSDSVAEVITPLVVVSQDSISVSDSLGASISAILDLSSEFTDTVQVSAPYVGYLNAYFADLQDLVTASESLSLRLVSQSGVTDSAYVSDSLSGEIVTVLSQNLSDTVTMSEGIGTEFLWRFQKLHYRHKGRRLALDVGHGALPKLGRY